MEKDTKEIMKEKIVQRVENTKKNMDEKIVQFVENTSKEAVEKHFDLAVSPPERAIFEKQDWDEESKELLKREFLMKRLEKYLNEYGGKLNSARIKSGLEL